MSYVLPHNLDAERSVLGAILIDNEALPVASAVVESHHFFRFAHQRIFDALLRLAHRGQPMDLVTLTEAMSTRATLEDAGGPAYLASLIDGVPRTTNVAYYARIVVEKARLRAFIKHVGRRVSHAYTADTNVDDLLAATAADLSSLTTGLVSTTDPDRFVTAADTCRDQEQVPMVLEPYLPVGTIGSFIAKIKIGKTSLALAMILCLRRCVGFCGFPAPPIPVRVMYLTEQPRASCQATLRCRPAGGRWRDRVLPGELEGQALGADRARGG